MRDRRDWRIRLREDVEIVARRDAEPLFKYSVVLLAKRDGDWQAVRAFDNSHDVQEHHEHAYVGMEPQPPIISYGPPTLEMPKVLQKLKTDWADIVDEWDKTR